MSRPRPLALVTGASSGIGAEYAQRLAASGHDLVLVARRRNLLENLAGELGTRYGVEAEALAQDLATDEGARRVEARIVRAPNLEFLVNNAGFGTRGLFFETDAEGQDRMHRLHVLATARLTRAALSGMVGRGKGAVVNVSSVAAFARNPGNVGYCATKAWMNVFTEGLRLELSGIGSAVKVQALCPGYTLTGFHEALGTGRGHASAGWWMTPEAVVDASLRGLAKDRLFVVPGLRYKVLVAAIRVMPRFLLHAAVARRRGSSTSPRRRGSGPA